VKFGACGYDGVSKANPRRKKDFSAIETRHWARSRVDFRSEARTASSQAISRSRARWVLNPPHGGVEEEERFQDLLG